MKKAIVFCGLTIFVYANSDYIPLSQMSDNEKIEHNFVKEEKAIKIENQAKYKSLKEMNIENDNKNTQNIVKKVEETKEINNAKENKEIVNQNFANEYKKETILKDAKQKRNVASKSDFSITPKITYMHLNTENNNIEIEKKHIVIPEISFTYKDQSIKFDYFKANTAKDKTNTKLDTKWYKISYLYKYHNANIGFAYNRYKLDAYDQVRLVTAKQTFPTLELHLKNEQDQLIFEYGGFYGKNSKFIKSAYGYYLNFGYKMFDNDNLIFTAGYKNRTVETDIGDRFKYEGPTIGVSSTF